jgi:hypothetical protein
LTWGTTKVKEGGDDADVTDEAKPAIEYVMLVDASNRLEKYASAALRAGVDAALVRIAESQGSRLFDAIEQIPAALGLTDVQRALIPTVVPPILRAIGEATPSYHVIGGRWTGGSPALSGCSNHMMSESVMATVSAEILVATSSRVSASLATDIASDHSVIAPACWNASFARSGNSRISRVPNRFKACRNCNAASA